MNLFKFMLGKSNLSTINTTMAKKYRESPSEIGSRNIVRPSDSNQRSTQNISVGN